MSIVGYTSTVLASSSVSGALIANGTIMWSLTSEPCEDRCSGLSWCDLRS
ncbi:MAG: hypothetical protein R3B51_05105 [Thermodesulfobacteriota bacterium]